MTNSKFSILTITRNDPDGLHDTIRSLRSQNFSDYTHYIQDSSSLRVRSSYSPYLRDYFNSSRSSIRYFAQPDTGIYNAMNILDAYVPKNIACFLILEIACDSSSLSRMVSLVISGEPSDHTVFLWSCSNNLLKYSRSPLPLHLLFQG